MKFIDIFGYIGSFVVLVSFLMKDIIMLRIVNTIACIMFVVYGWVMDVYPVVITNIIVIAINGFYILKHYLKKGT